MLRKHLKNVTKFLNLSPTPRNCHHAIFGSSISYLVTDENNEFPEFILVKSCKMKGKRSNEQILLLYRLDCYNQFLQYQETAKVVQIAK